MCEFCRAPCLVLRRPHRLPPAPCAETSQARIEEAFKEFTNREDVAVLLINQVSCC